MVELLSYGRNNYFTAQNQVHGSFKLLSTRKKAKINKHVYCMCWLWTLSWCILPIRRTHTSNILFSYKRYYDTNSFQPPSD